jgi:hypothetical protein
VATSYYRTRCGILGLAPEGSQHPLDFGTRAPYEAHGWHQTARVHHAACRRSRLLAACGTRAAGVDAGDRVSRYWISFFRAWLPYEPHPGFNQGLSETGFVEGRNVAIEYRWADNHNERLPALAADLVPRQVSLIVTNGPGGGGGGGGAPPPPPPKK